MCQRGALGQPPIPTWDLLTPRLPPGTCNLQVNSAQHLEQRLFIYFTFCCYSFYSQETCDLLPGGGSRRSHRGRRSQKPDGASAADSTPHRLLGKELPFPGVPAINCFRFRSSLQPDSTACEQRLILQMNEMGPSQAPGLPRARAGEAGLGITLRSVCPPWALGKGRSGFKSQVFQLQQKHRQ